MGINIYSQTSVTERSKEIAQNSARRAAESCYGMHLGGGHGFSSSAGAKETFDGPAASAKSSTGTMELNLLASLIGISSKDTAEDKTFRITSLFPDDPFDG